MFRLITQSLTTGSLTEVDPFGTRASFGYPIIDFNRCTACAACVEACPTGAIHAATPAAGRKTLTLSYASRIQCRACAAARPGPAVGPGHTVEIAAYSRQQLARTASFDVNPDTGRWAFREVEVEPGDSLADGAARLRARIPGRLSRTR